MLTDYGKNILQPRQFRGDDKTVSLLKEKNNVRFVYNSNVTKLNGENKLESIEITNKIDNSKEVLPIDGLFIAIGKIPENENFSKLLEVDENGYIIANENCKTSVPGIFVAGDNRTKEVRQLVTATSDGAVAAVEAVKYINNKNTK